MAETTTAPSSPSEPLAMTRAGGVLLVESDPDLQWWISRILTGAGHRVVGTSSSDGALALLSHFTVDVAIVAEHLPGMAGVDLGKRIKRDHPEVPVILIAEDGPEVERAARTAGAAAWLTKPFVAEELHAAIRSIAGAELHELPRAQAPLAVSVPSPTVE